MRCHWVNELASFNVFSLHGGVRSVATGAGPFMAMLVGEKGLAAVGVRRYTTEFAEFLNQGLGCGVLGMGSGGQYHGSADSQIDE